MKGTRMGHNKRKMEIQRRTKTDVTMEARMSSEGKIWEGIFRHDGGYKEG